MGLEREGENLLSLPENSLNFYSKAVGLYESKKNFLNADFKSLSSLEPSHSSTPRDHERDGHP